MDRTDKALELFERAAQLGVRLEFDSSLAFAVRQKVPGDLAEDGQGAIIEQLVKYLPEVRRLAELRAISFCAKAFLGKQILFREVGTDDRGLTVSIVKEGVLTGVEGGGALTISTHNGGRSLQMTARAEDLLIVVVDEEGALASAQPRKGIFGRFRR